jgi:antitoxin HigA-1
MAHESLVKGDPKMPPVHPGELLREEAFPAMGISVAAAARGMHISRQMLHGILAEKRGITPEMALRLGKLIGNGPGLWLRMQQNYDMWRAQALLTEELVQRSRRSPVPPLSPHRAAPDRGRPSEGEAAPMTISKAYDNVFEALEDDVSAASNLKLRGRLMTEIRRFIDQRGLTQTQAARELGITQPRLSDLMRGQISRFSLDALVNMAATTGVEVVIAVKRKAAKRGLDRARSFTRAARDAGAAATASSGRDRPQATKRR